jgi:hypothetical protein
MLLLTTHGQHEASVIGTRARRRRTNGARETRFLALEGWLGWIEVARLEWANKHRGRQVRHSFPTGP